MPCTRLKIELPTRFLKCDREALKHMPRSTMEPLFSKMTMLRDQNTASPVQRGNKFKSLQGLLCIVYHTHSSRPIDFTSDCEVYLPTNLLIYHELARTVLSYSLISSHQPIMLSMIIQSLLSAGLACLVFLTRVYRSPTSDHITH